ncbi:MAG: TRZ/ATZ family hydrolase [Pseudomonadales bacterium]
MTVAATRQNAELVISPGWLAPVDADNSLLTQHSVVVSNGRIIDLLPSNAVHKKYIATEHRELPQHLLIPGLVNGHGHAAMTLLRGFADDVPLMTWLEQHIWPTETRWMSEDFVRDGVEIAIAEMLRSGTTCFTDMYFFPNITAAIAHQRGIRAQVCFPVLEIETIWAKSSDEYIDKGLQIRDDFNSSSYVQVGFGPHAPYTVSVPTLERIATLANQIDCSVHMHVHETTDELQRCESEFGVRPLQLLQEIGLTSPRLQCAHMTHLDDTDFTILADSGSHVIHCPESNLKLGSGFCPVQILLSQHTNVALGTDGAASNNDLSMLAEMHTAALLAKGVADDPAAVPAMQALRMATLNGAKALGMDEHIGSISIGKAADLVAVDCSELEAQPMYHPVSQLVYTQSSHRVSDVWIGGKQLLKNRELTQMSLPALIDKANDWRQHMG